MNTAQQRLSELNAWINASSQQCPAPMSGTVDMGPYAVIVPTALDVIPAPFDPEALPLWIPEAQTPAGLPVIDTTAPASQDRMHCRLTHLIWLIEQGRLPPMAIVGLEDDAETIQAAIDRAGASSLDLTVYPLLCVPMWDLPEDVRAPIARKLPFLP